MDQIDKSLWINKLWDPLEKIDDSPLHSKRERIKVAAYCRVSLDPTRMSQSMESQMSHYTHIIYNKENWDFVGIYLDNMVTGKKASLRRGFTRMIRHCEEGRIDLILVKSVSRFSRNAKELLEIVEKLKSINVTIYFETENIESTRVDSAYLLKVYAGLAQKEIEEISESVAWGYEKLMIAGKPKINSLYGYKHVKTEGGNILEVIQEEAGVVREIFDMYLAGKNLNAIALELSNRNIKTKQGNSFWNPSSIKLILKNIAYIGSTHSRKKTRDLLSNKVRSSEGIRDQYITENTHPAIISDDKFYKVQELFLNSKKDARKSKIAPKRSNPLFKRFRCGNCGQNFRMQENLYRCAASSLNKNACKSPTVNRDTIKSILLDAFNYRFGLDKPKILIKLKRKLIRINQNDNFEFHRLIALTRIQAARKLVGTEFTENDIYKMEEVYKELEEQLIKIEDDRKYRIESIEWLENIESVEEFREHATIPLLRAWVKEIELYSKEDYVIYWIDGAQTEKGNCVPITTRSYDENVDKNEKNNMEYKDADDSSPLCNNLDYQKGGAFVDARNEEKTMLNVDSSIQNNSETIVKKINKQLSQSVFLQSSVSVGKKTKKKVAAYIRVSTDQESQTTSLKTQYSYYLYLILKEPAYDLVDIYVDDGKSGTTTVGRSEFNRMIEDCKAGRIDLIITKSVSRFARNTLDTLHYINLLKQLETATDIWFERENLRSLDDQSNLIIKIMAVLAQEESKNIGESIAWGRRSLAQRGIVRPGNPGYGYELSKDNTWIIDEEKAAVVRRIYDEALKGKRPYSIARKLSEDNIPSPTGKNNWCHSTVVHILYSEKYAGNYIYQKEYLSDGLEKKRLTNTGVLPKYLIETHHEPIIASEKWESVQRIMFERKEKYKSKSGSSTETTNSLTVKHTKNKAFENILYCGKCGGPVGYSIKSHKVYKYLEYSSWRCYRGNKKRCEVLQFSQEYIEDNFKQLLMQVKFGKELQDQAILYKEELGLDCEDANRRRELESEKLNLSQKLHDAVSKEIGKRGKNTVVVNAIISEILKIREELKELAIREEKLEMFAEELNVILNTLKSYNDSSKNRFGYYKSISEFPVKTFEKCIEKALLNHDGTITYHFKSGFFFKNKINYSDYKIMLDEIKKEDFLKSNQIRELIEYCKEPRSITEMMNYSKLFKDRGYFKRRIIIPLIEKGELQEISGKQMNKYSSQISKQRD